MAISKPETYNGVTVPYEASLDTLEKEIHTPNTKAWAAFMALAHKKEPEALDILITSTRSDNFLIRHSAVKAIGYNKHGQKASEIVCALLDDEYKFVVLSAIEAAQNLKLDCAHEKIINFVKKPDEETKVTALEALSTLWQKSDFQIVFERYLYDSSDEVKKQAAHTLANNVDRDNRQPIFLTWKTDPIPRHRIWACRIFEDFGKKSDITSLNDLLEDKDGHVRKAAARAKQRLFSDLKTRWKEEY